MHPSETADQPSQSIASDHASQPEPAPRPAIALPFLDRPVGAILAVAICSLIVAALTYLLARPFLPPMPKISDAADASDAVVATVLIPSVIHSLIASLLFLATSLLLAKRAGRQQLSLLTAQPGNGIAAQRQRGAIRIGLGDRALGAPGLLAMLVCCIALYAVLLSYLQFHGFDDFFGSVFRASAAWRVTAFLVFGLLAPLAEEMMFRGWLWTTLRRSWPGFQCTLAAGLIWLLTHFAEGPAKMAVLAPVALLLGIARQSGASLRASLLLHLALNLTSLTVPFLLRWAALA